jgi:hypothetical protein
MKNLHVFSFNQHWFHLGSMVENVLDREEHFEGITLNFFQQHLRVLPVDMHFRFPLSRLFRNSPEKIAIKYLKSKRDIEFKFIDLEKQEIPVIDLPEDIEGLKSLRINNLQIGMAVASHLISLTKDSQPEINSIRHQILSCLQFYHDVKKWFHQQNYTSTMDEIWVCNGRTFHERIIVELAKEIGVKVSFYEIGGEGQVPSRWILHEVSPHDRNLHQIEIMRHSELNEPKRKEIEEWFLSHEDPAKNRFASKGTDSGKIKAISKTPYIVYFSSSDDEVAAISSEWNSPWGSQLSAIKSVMEVFAEQNKYNFVIRVHPNQGNKSKRDKNAWDNLIPEKNCYIFKYSEDVDSYELMRNSAAVLTHGSTMGVEAAFRRKHQAFLSPTRFDQLVPATQLRDKTSLKEWIEILDPTRNLSHEKEYMGALMWANYMLTAGSNWKNIVVRKKSERIIGYLDGLSLRPRNLYIALTRMHVSIYRELSENRFALFRWNRGTTWRKF